MDVENKDGGGNVGPAVPHEDVSMVPTGASDVDEEVASATKDVASEEVSMATKEVARQDGGGNDPASSATVNEDVALVPTAVVVEAVVHKNISPHVLLINLMYMSQARLKNTSIS